MKSLAFLLLTWLAVALLPAPVLAQRAAKPVPATTLTLTVTDGSGVPIAGVHISATGTVNRDGTTDAEGIAKFAGVRAGTYRLLFEHEGFITFEKEIAWRPGQPAVDASVMLNEAPPAAPVAEAEPQPSPGVALAVSLPSFIEQNFISNSEPQKTTNLGCSGRSEGLLWQIREPWLDRSHDDSDAMLYVVGGGGTLRLGTRTVPLEAGTFAVVPRGTAYALTRSGRNPLILLAVITGPACL